MQKFFTFFHYRLGLFPTFLRGKSILNNRYFFLNKFFQKFLFFLIFRVGARISFILPNQGRLRLPGSQAKLADVCIDSGKADSKCMVLWWKRIQFHHNKLEKVHRDSGKSFLVKFSFLHQVAPLRQRYRLT